jgi:hypothetical protein
MVEIHYEEERGVEGTAADTELVHWRVIVNDVDAALAQVAQDLADGRQPLAIVEHDPTGQKWDVRRPYQPAAWKDAVPRAQLRRRAEAIGPAF